MGAVSVRPDGPANRRVARCLSPARRVPAPFLPLEGAGDGGRLPHQRAAAPTRQGAARRRACRLPAVLMPVLLLAHAPCTGCDTNAGSAAGVRIRQRAAPQTHGPEELRAGPAAGQDARRARRAAGGGAERYSNAGSARAARGQGRGGEAGLQGRRQRVPAEIWLEDSASCDDDGDDGPGGLQDGAGSVWTSTGRARDTPFRAGSPAGARGGKRAQSRWERGGGRCGRGDSVFGKTAPASEVDASPCTPGDPPGAAGGAPLAHAHAHKLSAPYAAPGRVRGGDGADDRACCKIGRLLTRVCSAGALGVFSVCHAPAHRRPRTP